MNKAIVALSLAIALPALAQTQTPAAPKPPKAPQLQQPDRTVGLVFDEIQKRLIREYFGPADEGKGHDKARGRDKGKAGERGKSGALPPGLERQGSLPPGLAKKGERLPPGLAKRDLPRDLEHKLGRPARGTQRIIAGEDVVLIEAATGIVLDVLEGAARRQK